MPSIIFKYFLTVDTDHPVRPDQARLFYPYLPFHLSVSMDIMALHKYLLCNAIAE